jgi:internalin A
MKRLLVVVGLVLALQARARADEEAAIKAIEKLGGKVYRDEKQPGKPVTRVALNGTEFTDAGIKDLKELKELRELRLIGTQVTDAGLKELKELKELRELRLNFTKVTVAGVADLQKALPACNINLQ